jgi:hypothetical protein
MNTSEKTWIPTFVRMTKNMVTTQHMRFMIFFLHWIPAFAGMTYLGKPFPH